MLYNKEAKHVFKRKQTPRGKLLKELQSGNTVRVHNGKDWVLRGQIVKSVAPRSYDVVTEDGSVLRRNRLHLLETNEDFQKVSEIPDMEENHPVLDNPTLSELPAEQPDVSSSSVPNLRNTSGPEPLRRSTRIRKPPERLNL